MKFGKSNWDAIDYIMLLLPKSLDGKYRKLFEDAVQIVYENLVKV